LLANEIAHTGYQMFTIASQLISYAYAIGIALVVLFVFVISKRTKIGCWKTLFHLREMMVVAFVSGSAFASLPFGISRLNKNFKLWQPKVNLSNLLIFTMFAEISGN
jgi:Na+/H+-dicarboxylate symporter